MRALLLLVLLSTLLVVPVSADNITIELFQNSQDVFFVKYNGDLTECADDECTFEVTNYSSENYTYSNTTGIELSRNDMRKIAQYVALEIDTPAYTGGVVNDTTLTASLAKTREDTTDNLRAYISNTVMPSVEELDEVKQKLSESESTISDLQSKAREYDLMKETKDETISVLKDENVILTYLCGILTVTFIAVLGFNSQSFKRIMELRRQKR